MQHELCCASENELILYIVYGMNSIGFVPVLKKKKKPRFAKLRLGNMFEHSYNYA